MRVLYEPRSKSTKIPYLQRGGTLSGVNYNQGGSGFFGNLLKTVKTMALPALKAVAKTALPMVKSAVTAGLAADGSLSDRLRATGQTALTKKESYGSSSGRQKGRDGGRDGKTTKSWRRGWRGG